MSEEFMLPALGEGVDQGDVVKILVAAGDALTEGDSVLEVESGKATAEIPADFTGTVEEILIQEGDTVEAGQRVLTWRSTGDDQEGGETSTDDRGARTGAAPATGTSGQGREGASAQTGDRAERRAATHAEEDDTEHARDNEARDDKARDNKARDDEARDDEARDDEAHDDEAHDEDTRDRSGPTPPRGPVMATPSVRRLARELGLDIHAVDGSGPGGRIVEADVMHRARALIATGGRRPGVRVLHEDAPDYDDWGPVRREPMGAVRRATAQHLATVWPQVPRVTNFLDADFAAVSDLRDRLARRDGPTPSPTAILVKILAAALRAHPRLNASIDPGRDQIVMHEYVSIGVAVDTPRGLLVPVVRHVDRLDVGRVHETLADLADRARAGRLKAADLRGATCTISNLGGLGGGWFTPIVDAPAAAILGVGRATMQPVWQDGAFVPRLRCPLSLSYDHRLVDGADAARFLGWIGDVMANPLLSYLQGEHP